MNMGNCGFNLRAKRVLLALGFTTLLIWFCLHTFSIYALYPRLQCSKNPNFNGSYNLLCGLLLDAKTLPPPNIYQIVIELFHPLLVKN